MILENQDITKPLVILEIEHAIAVGPEDVLDSSIRQGSQSCQMVGSFDDHFVGADAVHFVEEAFAFAIEIAFDAKSRKFVGHYAHRPPWRVGAAIAASV